MCSSRIESQAVQQRARGWKEWAHEWRLVGSETTSVHREKWRLVALMVQMHETQSRLTCQLPTCSRSVQHQLGNTTLYEEVQPPVWLGSEYTHAQSQLEKCSNQHPTSTTFIQIAVPKSQAQFRAMVTTLAEPSANGTEGTAGTRQTATVNYTTRLQ